MQQRIVCFVLASGLFLATPVSAQPTLEIEDYVETPMTGKVEGKGSNELLLSRVNTIREEVGGANRFFISDLNGPLYIFDKATKKFTVYLDFNGLEGTTGIFRKLYLTRGYGNGLNGFYLDPEYTRNGKFYTVHIEDPSLPGSNLPNNASFPGLNIAGYAATDAIKTPGPLQNEGVLIQWTDSNPSNSTFEGTARELLRVQLNTTSHPMGDLIFNPTARPGDPDWRVLYLECGDGASGESKIVAIRSNPQRLDNLQGKILRIIPDLDNHAATSAVSENGRYRIPNDNPFVNTPGARKEIWAYGFRNPHRLNWAVDPSNPANNRLIVNSVGMSTWETVYLVHKGANYGYARREGNELFRDDNKTGPLPEDDRIPLQIGETPTDRLVVPTYPVIQYDHGPNGGDSIGSGFLYNGKAIPALRGKYVFTDLTTGRIWYAEYKDILAADDGKPETLAPIHQLQVRWSGKIYDDMFPVVETTYHARGGKNPRLPGPAGLIKGGRSDVRFAIDAAGELYLYSKGDGMIRKVVGFAPTPPTAAQGQQLFAQLCQTCHGPASAGDRGPALTRAAFTHGGSDDEIFQTIRKGVQGSQMPPFRDLRDEQVRQLVAYIQGLRRAAGNTGGVRRNEDTFSLYQEQAPGKILAVDKLTRATRRLEITPVTAHRLVNAAAEPHNWLTYWGDYQGTHYSGLKQIDTTNVQRLQAVWAFAMPGESVLEATPLVVDGVMYMTEPGVVVALDARTGRQLWRYARKQKQKNPNEINPFNRGVAALDHRLFFTTLDAALVALDARTGQALWETQVADTMLGYSLTSAPLVAKDKIIVGITGGEFGARGFLDAYDVTAGKRLWRWYAVPGPGEFGNDTWKSDSWKQGGSPMWLTGSYDPDLNLLYWTVGNPAPQIDRSVRGDLDNLFSDSVVAIDADTGLRKWHYQFTPNDGHDWDSCQDVLLVDRIWRGHKRKLLLHADRNGIFYVLDRTNGEFLSGTPFVYVNWMNGFDSKGRPKQVPGSNSSEEGSFFVYPTLGGATNFQAPSYSPATGWLYLEYSENGQRYVSRVQPFEEGKHYIGRATAARTDAVGPKPGEPERSAGIKALDPDTGKTMWDFKISQGSLANGVLATAGNVVFGAVRDGNFLALDARTGKHLWHFQTGANMNASPISYSIDGRQFVAIAAGNTLYSFALPE